MESFDTQVLVTSAMRVGSTWMIRILQEYYGIPHVYINEEQSAAITNSGNIWTVEDKLVKSHLILPKDYFSLLENNPQLKIVRVRRDFRDALASRFYYSRYHADNNEILKLGEESDSDHELLLKVVENSDIIQNWYNLLRNYEGEFEHERFLDISYEEMKADGYLKLDNFFCGNFKPIFEKLEFSRCQQLEKNNTGRKGKALFCREGKIGKGRELFTDDIYEQIQKG